jgi:hypothetical protein
MQTEMNTTEDVLTPERGEYSLEEHDVQAVFDMVVGSRDDDDPEAWYGHLCSGTGLLAEVVSRIADQKALVALEIYESLDGKARSYQSLCEVLGVSRSLAQQLVERARGVR